MYSRHLEIPVFEFRAGHLEAQHYNRVQLALKRLSNLQNHLRFPLPGLKTLDLILQQDAWIIVDRAFNDIPIAAWLDFESQHRADLHSPIECKIRLFHNHAGIILQRVLDSMDKIIDEGLAKRHGSDDKRVISFHQPDEKDK